MQTVNAAFMAEFNRSLVTRFKMGLGRTPVFWPRLAQRETSTTGQNVYLQMGKTGSLREWIGDRIAEQLRAYDFAIKNRHFEKTLRANKDLLEDDQAGLYGNEAEQLGDAANRHPDKLIAALLTGGFANLGYDGVAFFATTHPNQDGTTWSNKGTTALSADSYAAARQQMMAQLDEGGEVIDVRPDLLVVPPALEATAKLILSAEYLPTTSGNTIQPNIWRGTAEVMVLPRLTDTNDWFLLDTTQVLRPFIMQFRKDPVLTSLTALDDENVFRRNEFLWGVDYRGEAGYSLPQLAFGAQVA